MSKENKCLDKSLSYGIEGDEKDQKRGMPMKEIFQALARYNRSVNQSILELVEPLGEEQLKQKTKAYFSTLFDTLFHLLVGDLYWLSRFREFMPESQALAGHPLITVDLKGLRKRYDPDYRMLFQDRRALDDIILQLIDEIEESRLSATVQYTNFKGEIAQGVLWKILLNWFNHQTHHRGQVSIQLDLLDIKNDFSSLLDRI